MANEGEKVVEELSEEKQCVKTQMLPPALPISKKKKEKNIDVQKSDEKVDISAKVELEKRPESFTSSAKKSESECKKDEPKSSNEIEKNEMGTTPVSYNENEDDVHNDNETKNDEGELPMHPPNPPDKKNEKVESSQKESTKKEPSKKESYPEIPYTEPPWSGIPQDNYYIELLKGGCIKSSTDLTTKSYYLFGRLPNCDVVMEHPSISRYHAIIQYKANDSTSGKRGFYLYDLNSTHGTKVNKIAIQPKRYYRLQVGYVIKFGGSSRLYILQGPEEMEEEETPAEPAAKQTGEVGKVMTEAEYEEWKKEKERKPDEENADDACTWGFGEDAVEEDTVNPFASELEEGEADAHEFKDPKKTLRGYFEREGLELEYLVDETGPGHARVYHCRVKLPIEDANGDSLYAEAAVTGKKREAVLACATEACRLLDRNGLLRQSSHESKKHKMKNWEENDYYDSDEDIFLDRTGSIEKKRQKRMKMAKKEKEEVETFESLSSKLQLVEDEITSLEEKLANAMKAVKAAEESEDSLESYMKNIDTSMDKTSRMQMRRKIFDLKKERQRLTKLVNIARPASLPTFVNTNQTSTNSSKEKINKTEASSSSSSTSNTSTTVDPNTETRHSTVQPSNFKSPSTPTTSQPPITKTQLDVEKRDTIEKCEDQKDESFVRPTMAVPQSKPKPVALSSSISGLLEGLKESAGGKLQKSSKTEKRQRKHLPVSHEEPVEKKKAMYPLPPSPPSAPSGEQDKNAFDEDYSDWVPPTDQTGDGRTKMNEKYGY